MIVAVAPWKRGQMCELYREPAQGCPHCRVVELLERGGAVKMRSEPGRITVVRAGSDEDGPR